MSLELAVEDGFIRCCLDGELVWSERVPQHYPDDFDDETLAEYIEMIFCRRTVNDVSEPTEEEVKESVDAKSIADALGVESFDDDLTKLIQDDERFGTVGMVIRDDEIPIEHRIMFGLTDDSTDSARQLHDFSSKGVDARDEP